MSLSVPIYSGHWLPLSPVRSYIEDLRLLEGNSGPESGGNSDASISPISQINKSNSFQEELLAVSGQYKVSGNSYLLYFSEA